jgi:hypothetical protein
MSDDRPWTIAIPAALLLLLSASVEAAEAVKIDEIVVGAPIPDAQRDAAVEAIRIAPALTNIHKVAARGCEVTCPAGASRQS